MATEATLYDLVLVLVPEAEESTRAKILSDVESAITGVGGSVERNDDWGRRPLAYEIRHLAEGEYHLLQFQAPGTLIEELSHTLTITDGVLRFRIIKVAPGTPEAPSSPPPVVVAATASHSGSGGSSSGSTASGGSASPGGGASGGGAPPRNDAPASPDAAEAPGSPGGAGAESADEPAAES
ncbi:MAG: 30S ribosomal protein S6 [Solirubrobacterales bacterium]|nr:30S ribosomal protein S6 [Solirubrobacterales bacterium]